MNLEQLFESIRSADHHLFYMINSVWTHPYADAFFPHFTDLHRNPLALLSFAFCLIYWIFRQRARAIKGILVIAIAVAASDLICYRVLKATYQRHRPAAAGLPVQLRSEHHTGTSFPSNHAANVFAAATVITALYPPYFFYAFLVAAAVAYSRVYVGVHFPSDVIAGAFVGILFGRVVWKILGWWVNRSRRE